MADNTVETAKVAAKAEKPVAKPVEVVAEKPVEKAKPVLPELGRDQERLVAMGFTGCKRILVIRCDGGYVAAMCGMLAKIAALDVVADAGSKAVLEEATKDAAFPVNVLRGIPRHGGEAGYDGIFLAGENVGADAGNIEDLLRQDRPAVVALSGTGDNSDGAIRTAIRASVLSYSGPRLVTSSVMVYESQKK
jgi:hypothetical protein